MIAPTRARVLADDLEQALQDLDSATAEVFAVEAFAKDDAARRENLFGTLERINSAKLIVEATRRDLLQALAEAPRRESAPSESKTRIRSARRAS